MKMLVWILCLVKYGNSTFTTDSRCFYGVLLKIFCLLITYWYISILLSCLSVLCVKLHLNPPFIFFGSAILLGLYGLVVIGVLGLNISNFFRLGTLLKLSFSL